MDLAEVTWDHAVGIGPLVVGVLFVIALMVARALYIRRKRQEPPVPASQPRRGAWETRDEVDHGAPPDHGPGHQDGPEPKGYDYDHENCLPEPVEPGDRRLYPSELSNDYRTSSRRGEDR
ncbi:DUF6479 family protein [Streptomyces capparidis]